MIRRQKRRSKLLGQKSKKMKVNWVKAKRKRRKASKRD